MWHRMTAPLY